MKSWLRGVLLALVFLPAGSPVLAQSELPAGMAESLGLGRVREVATFSADSGRYFAVAALAPDSELYVDVWLVRPTDAGTEVLFRLSEHRSLVAYMEETRATSVSSLKVFDIDLDGHPELFLHVACECLDHGSDVVVDGATGSAVAYRLAAVDEIAPVYPTHFEPLPADHALALHAAYLLGRIYYNPFARDYPEFDAAVEDRDLAVALSRPRILEP